MNTGDESQSNAKAGEAVKSLVQDQNASRDESLMAASVIQALQDVDPKKRARAVHAAARIVSECEMAPVSLSPGLRPPSPWRPSSH